MPAKRVPMILVTLVLAWHPDKILYVQVDMEHDYGHLDTRAASNGSLNDKGSSYAANKL